MGVARGTTPTFKFTVPDEIDLTQANNVYVTFYYKGETLTKTGNALTVTAHEVDVFLTQQETLSFPVGNIEVQINWTTNGGMRYASEIETVAITRQLITWVLS